MTNPVEKLARAWSAAETFRRAPLPPIGRTAFPPRVVLTARPKRAAGAPTFPQPPTEPQTSFAQTLAPVPPPLRDRPRPDITSVTAWIDFQTEEGSGYRSDGEPKNGLKRLTERLEIDDPRYRPLSQRPAPG